MGSYLNKPQQHLVELQEFLAFLKSKELSSYLEVGCKFGGVVWPVARQMPKGSRIVAVDLPNGPWGRSESQLSLEACVAHLKRDGYDAHLFIGDSTDNSIVQKVRDLGPFDAVFIDANHTEPYVRKDFANYGTRARIVCMHDIGWDNPTPPGRMAIEVPKVWREFKETFKEKAKFSEIRRDHRHNGIGILEWL